MYTTWLSSVLFLQTYSQYHAILFHNTFYVVENKTSPDIFSAWCQKVKNKTKNLNSNVIYLHINWLALIVHWCKLYHQLMSTCRVLHNKRIQRHCAGKSHIHTILTKLWKLQWYSASQKANRLSWLNFTTIKFLQMLSKYT